MKRLSWILAVAFGLLFLGATTLNAWLIGRARGAVAGGGQPAKSETRRFHVAVIMPDTDDSFFGGLLDGIALEAELASVAVQVFRYAESSPQEADRYFEIALRAKVDGITMFRARSESGREREAAAARAGVVYIPVGTDAPAGETGTFLGSGSLLQGYAGGQLIGEKLGSSARVGIIIVGAKRGKGRSEPLYLGLSSALKVYGGASVSAVAESGTGILSSEAAAESMLRAHPDLNAILCSSAQDTAGAVQVLIDRGAVGRVMIIGADETPDIKRYIDKGVVAASLVRDSRRIGQEAIKTFMQIKTGGRPVGPVETGFFVVRRKEPAR